MKNRSIIVAGIYVGLGIFVGNAVVLPLISKNTFTSGIQDGAITGVIAIALFLLYAVFTPEKGNKNIKKDDADSGGSA